MNTIWQFKTKNFRVALSWDYEADADLSWDDDGEVTAKLESGEYVNCLFKVAVYGPNGAELAADYLGNSIHERPEDFRDHLGIAAKGRADGHNYGSYFTDMVRQVISEAREALRQAQTVYLRAA